MLGIEKYANKTRNQLDMKALKEDVKMHPDGYPYERAARLGVSQRAIGYALKRLGVSYKKNTVASESEVFETSQVLLPENLCLTTYSQNSDPIWRKNS